MLASLPGGARLEALCSRQQETYAAKGKRAELRLSASLSINCDISMAVGTASTIAMRSSTRSLVWHMCAARTEIHYRQLQPTNCSTKH